MSAMSAVKQWATLLPEMRNRIGSAVRDLCFRPELSPDYIRWYDIGQV
jgi:hypothetical protein